MDFGLPVTIQKAYCRGCLNNSNSNGKIPLCKKEKNREESKKEQRNKHSKEVIEIYYSVQTNCRIIPALL